MKPNETLEIVITSDTKNAVAESKGLAGLRETLKGLALPGLLDEEFKKSMAELKEVLTVRIK